MKTKVYAQIIDDVVQFTGGEEVGLPLPQDYLKANPYLLNLDITDEPWCDEVLPNHYIFRGRFYKSIEAYEDLFVVHALLDEGGFVVSAERCVKEDQILLKANEVVLDYADYPTCIGKKFENGKLITITNQDEAILGVLNELKNEVVKLKSELDSIISDDMDSPEVH